MQWCGLRESVLEPEAKIWNMLNTIVCGINSALCEVLVFNTASSDLFGT